MVQISKKYSPILVYQMGKVGYSTIHASLSAIMTNNHVYSIHYLSSSSIQSVERYYLKKSKPVPSHIKNSKQIRQFIDKYLGQIRFKIITLVRDPVARNISSTFQNIELGLPHIKYTKKEQAVNDIENLLMNSFQTFDEDTDQVCTWFGKEIEDVFHFDIYSVPFDINRGYQIYSTQYSDNIYIGIKRRRLILSSENSLFLRFSITLSSFIVCVVLFGVFSYFDICLMNRCE